MAALLLAACSDEQEFASTPSGEGILRATVEGASPATRAGFDSEGAFYWTTGDQLGVTTTSSSTGFSALTLTSEAGQASGTFDGRLSGDLGSYAVYPYSASHSLNGTTLTYNFPATYNYTKVDADFFSATQGEGNSFNPAMCGSISNGSTQLKHLGGVFCIKIEKMPLATGKLIVTATDKDITGDFTANLGDVAPVLTSSGLTTSRNEVTITFSNASTETSGVFYIPVPTGTYNVRIKMTDNSDTTPAKIDAAAGTYTVNRCDLKQITLTESSIDAEPADDLEAAVTDLGTYDNVTVTGEVSSTSTPVQIPTKTPGNVVTKTLSLQNVPSGTSLEIMDASAEPENSVDNLIFSIPTNETANYDPLNLTVNMPNTTVTLAGNSGKAAYGEVTASTAKNTLILSSGVTVEKVFVKMGNIRVNSGAVLSAIERGEGNTEQIIIYKEEGATVSTILGDNIEVVDASVDDLKEICATGGEYTLNSDITGDFVVSATEPVIINLNGHTITNVSGDNFTVNIGSTLTINGEGIVDNISHQKACIYNNGTVTLNGGTYTRSKETGSSPTDPGTDPNSFYNILNHGIMTIKAGVTVEQAGGFSSLIDNGYYNYTSGNARTGYVSGTNHANPSLTIEGGEFQGGINTVKNDDGATLTINDGTFANTTQATVQNNNVVTINGGTFNPTGTATDALQSRYFAGGNNAGQSTITAGTFNGNLYFEGASATLEVSGGTFTDPSVLKYRAENADIAINLVEDKTVEGFITQNGQKLSIDMGGHTLTLGDPTVGSAGTETNSCQLLQGSEVTFRNGTLTSLNENIVIQNYCKLLLEDMTLDTPNALYSISNNNESCTMNNVTINAKSDGFAFDVYAFSSYEGVTVTVNGNSVINGKVDFGGDNNKTNIKLIINGGTFNGALSVDETYYTEAEPNIVISDTAVFAEDIAASWEKYKNPSSAEE